MALLSGRVNKNEWEHTALFANIVPVYAKGMYTASPKIVAANGIPDFILDVVIWICCNIPMPYEGFMFTHVKPITTETRKQFE
ncbi:hypothetical protein K5I76_004373 [Salmonella enterica]|uniref:Uncharacterized protein n=1 Tax=Salmonella enterica subsp. enterica serovar Cotham TaxID=2572724 RepID=A0A5I0ZJM7_SALET|nr:hypothetical protein [Salmonella enterica]EBP3975925.1 hypothetical protein [Salmonella enterica subsp. enterica]EBS2730820.1 hypothetical protein [Salmonella enterica subsp. enterica serovar Cotham]EBW2674266.1 hypothetical protein [Salmonella enterica subsp. enterica serovar Tennessee]ECG0829731.1 hypothetical protein [Salmonella enterica subsp. diarizonae]ECQ6773880.1 hypothetical protein [Salmonella enterica subsp. houtenae]ECT8370151.1 hypothetical protein [Salmonella enterica subsp. 